MEENKNEVRLNSFIKYCQDNPELRFWQAMQGWAYVEYKKDFPEKPEVHCIFAGFDRDASIDTFHWE